MEQHEQQKILVLDFGSQYSQLIARRIRECSVYSQVVPFCTAAEKIAAEKPAGIILSGGPASVYAEGAPQVDPGVFELGIPVLGICYGMQMLIHTLGGKVAPGEAREFGRAEMTVTAENDPLFAGVPREFPVWMSHGDKVVSYPAGTRVLARTANTENAAVVVEGRKLYGIQFHPKWCIRSTARRSSATSASASASARARGRWRASSKAASGASARRWGEIR